MAALPADVTNIAAIARAAATPARGMPEGDAPSVNHSMTLDALEASMIAMGAPAGETRRFVDEIGRRLPGRLPAIDSRAVGTTPVRVPLLRALIMQAWPDAETDDRKPGGPKMIQTQAARLAIRETRTRYRSRTIGFRVPEEEHEQLAGHAKDHGTTVHSLARAAMRHGLESGTEPDDAGLAIRETGTRHRAGMTSVRISFRVPEEEHEELARRAETHGTTVHSLARAAMRQWLESGGETDETG